MEKINKLLLLFLFLNLSCILKTSNKKPESFRIEQKITQESPKFGIRKKKYENIEQNNQEKSNFENLKFEIQKAINLKLALKNNYMHQSIQYLVFLKKFNKQNNQYIDLDNYIKFEYKKFKKIIIKLNNNLKKLQTKIDFLNLIIESVDNNYKIINDYLIFKTLFEKTIEALNSCKKEIKLNLLDNTTQIIKDSFEFFNKIINTQINQKELNIKILLYYLNFIFLKINYN